MGEFIRGRRRKTGLLTLILALALFVGWGRSFSKFDRWPIPADPYAFQRVSTMHGNLIWQRVSALDPLSWPNQFHNEAPAMFQEFAEGHAEGTFGLMLESIFDPTQDQQDSVVWSWRSWGFERGHRHHPSPDRGLDQDILKVSYWWLITPLTLISAWLILPKRQPRNLTGRSRVAEASASPA